MLNPKQFALLLSNWALIPSPTAKLPWHHKGMAKITWWLSISQFPGNSCLLGNANLCQQICSQMAKLQCQQPSWLDGIFSMWMELWQNANCCQCHFGSFSSFNEPFKFRQLGWFVCLLCCGPCLHYSIPCSSFTITAWQSVVHIAQKTHLTEQTQFKSEDLIVTVWFVAWRIYCRPPRQDKVEVSSSFQVITTSVWEQHPRSLHKGATGRVWTGNQQYPVLCHVPALSEVESCWILGRVKQAVSK